MNKVAVSRLKSNQYITLKKSIKFIGYLSSTFKSFVVLAGRSTFCILADF